MGSLFEMAIGLAQVVTSTGEPAGAGVLARPLPAGEVALRVVLALLFGAVLGAEREYRDKAAGLRTITLICVGAAMFTIFSIYIGGAHDSSRIAAQIVSGIGFLGAGAILRSNGHIVGLTTASTVWLAAAVGMGIGLGDYTTSAIGLGAGMVVLQALPPLERRIAKQREPRRYLITCDYNPELIEHFAGMLRQAGLRVQNRQQQKRADGKMVCIYDTQGRSAEHERFTRAALADPAAIEVSF